MKIALIGYGKMGHLLEEIAIDKGHRIVAKVNSCNAHKLLNAEGLDDAEVCIDFSHPSCVIENIKCIASLGKPLVVGTTGWTDELEAVKEIVLKTNIGFIYAPNFSMGVLLFMRLLTYACDLFNRFNEYDVALFEKHHREKHDTPSGTADVLANLILQHIDRKSSLVCDLLDREIAPSELNITSMRCGYEPGGHTILFDGPSDTIELKHSARNRMGFALGALSAASWIRNKKGFFTLENMLT